MALQKLYYVYGLDTACFYTDEENEIDKRIIHARVTRDKLDKIIAGSYTPKCIRKNDFKSQKDYKISCVEWCEKRVSRYNNLLSKTKKYITEKKSLLKSLLKDNIPITRTVRKEKIVGSDGAPLLKKRVAIFDSSLTRYFALKERDFNEEIVIIKVYFFDVAESIVKNGFYMNGYKYKFFSASAGQIRTKKLVAVREDLLNQYWNSLTAGLTIEKINKLGGMNINKFLAYLALSNSATDLWKDFNIDRCIVVDDFENQITGTVDFIDEKTYDIQRITQSLDFTQTDGCGMILPELSKKNFMVRLPWVKGLLASFDFIKFIKDNNCVETITDIYGDEHNIIEENIQIIFTKSQFKMWKFFKDWGEYQENFKKYNCTAGICNLEEDEIPNSVINYQMIQTLSDLTDEEIKSLAKPNNENIINLSKDLKTMLKVFGATNENYRKSSFQKCLEIYPELISDSYCRQTLKDLKIKLEKDLWSARFDIGGKYTFVVPDLYAFCEYLFLGIKNPKGILNQDEVCCRLYDDKEKLDCLRSPHLYLEHCIRKNNTDISWFNTNAIYVSCRDMISRVVQCDWDGDKLLVTNNPTLINAAERNIKKFDIVPLYYIMSKAKSELITPSNLFNGLKLAYIGGNIGQPSNDITKVWNCGEITDEKLKVIKWLVAEVNFTIDYAKTLYKPKRPMFADEIIKKYTKSKVPYFFRFAKDKNEPQTESITACSIDRISPMYPTKKLRFDFTQDNIGKFDYKVLMNNPNVKVIEEIPISFKEITSKLNFNQKVDNLNGDRAMNNYLAVYEQAKKDILSMQYNKNTIIDNIIIDLFKKRKTPLKTAFWFIFGDEVLKNIYNNIDEHFTICQRCNKRFYRRSSNDKYCDKCKGYHKLKSKTIICEDCGKEFEVSSNVKNKKRCDECQKEHRKNQQKELMRKKRAC